MLETVLQQFLTEGVFAFMLVFVRIGAALVIMPGIGDTFTPQRIRLFIALALTYVITPMVYDDIPQNINSTVMLFLLLLSEFFIGIFFGTLARIMLAALDVAGMTVSFMSGLGNAQIFNPGSGAQGSVMGAFLTVTGMVLIFTTELHHFLITGLVKSYMIFPAGDLPDIGDVSQTVVRFVSQSFMIGFQIAAPFMVIAMMIFIGMGVLTRLMPQVQVFILAIPLQVLLSLVTLTLVIAMAMLYWLTQFEQGMRLFYSGGL